MTDVRDSQYVRQRADTGEEAGRVSQIVRQFAVPLSAPARETQFLRQVAESISSAGRLSQFIRQYAIPPQRDRFLREWFVQGKERILAWTDLYLTDASGDVEIVKLGTHNLNRLSKSTGDTKVPPAVVSIGHYDRPLSGPSGEFRAGTLSARYSELNPDGTPNYRFRARLDSVSQYGFLNAEAVTWVISETGWRSGLLPVAYFRGRVSRYKPENDYQFAFEFKDWWSDKLLPRSSNQPAPLLGLPKLNVDFPDLPVALRDRRAPLLLGRKSDEGSLGDPPEIANEAGNGSYGPDSGFFGAGYGDRGDAPTSFTATPTGSGSTITPGTYKCVVDFKPTGSDVWSEVAPLAGGESVVVGSGENIDFACDNMGTGTYRFSIGTDGLRYYFYLESATPSASWDGANHSVYGEETAWIHQYVAAILYSDGYSGLVTTPVISVGRGPQRIIRFAFTKPVGALGARVWRKNALGDYTWQFDVPVTQVVSITAVDHFYFEDTPNSTNGAQTGPQVPRGRVPALLVGGKSFSDLLGLSSEWAPVLLSYGALPPAEGVYQEATAGQGDGVRIVDSAFDVGGDAAFPGLGDWDTLFGATRYLTRNGRRYAIGYVKGAIADALLGPALDGVGGRAITFNGTGIDEDGDGLGAPLTDWDQQLPWVFRNFLGADVPQPEIGGAWLAMPTYADGTERIETTSITKAASESLQADQVPSGRARGYYIIGEETAASVLRDMLISAWLSFGTNQSGQAVFHLLPPAPVGVLGSGRITHINEILGESFDVDDDPEPRANLIAYSYDYDDLDGSFTTTGQVAETEARARYSDRDDLTYQLALRGVSSAGQAGQIADLARRYFRRPERTVTTDRFFHGIHDDLGARTYLTHPEGAADGGFTSRFVQVRRTQPNYDGLTVQHAYHDLTWFDPNASVFFLESLEMIPIGGNRDGSCVDDYPDFAAVIMPKDYVVVTVPWSRIPDGWVADFSSVLSTATGTLALRVWKVTATAGAVGTDSATVTTARTKRTITITKPGSTDLEYVVQGIGAGGATALTARMEDCQVNYRPAA